jgi:hypothetical protein
MVTLLPTHPTWVQVVPISRSMEKPFSLDDPSAHESVTDDAVTAGAVKVLGAAGIPEGAVEGVVTLTTLDAGEFPVPLKASTR